MTNILKAQNKVATFEHKLELYQRRVQVGDVPMLLSERLVNDEDDNIRVDNFMVQHLSAVVDSVKQYFPDMGNRQSNSWILKPFSTDDDDDELFRDKEVAVKVKFLGLREDSTFKVEFQNYNLSKFWRKVGTEYPIMADRVLRMLIPFATTYRCKSGFSTLVTLRTKAVSI